MTPCSNSYKTRLSNGSKQQNTCTCIYLFIILLIAREFELRVFIFNLPELI